MPANLNMPHSIAKFVSALQNEKTYRTDDHKKTGNHCEAEYDGSIGLADKTKSEAVNNVKKGI